MKYLCGMLILGIISLNPSFGGHSMTIAQDGVKIFSLQPPDKDPMQDLPELNDTWIYGLSWRFKWMTIEPEEGRYQWEFIDKAIELSSKAGKQSMLRVTAGINTPEWVYRAGARPFDFSNSDLSHPEAFGKDLRMSIPWDEVYLTKWEAFIRAFGKRYNGNPNIYSIQMTGGGHIGEMNLPKVYEKWQQVGYSDEKLIVSWKRIIDAYQKSFPDIPTNLAINEPLGKRSKVLEHVVSYVLATYPRKVYLQQNALRADFPRDSRIRRTLREASARTVVGYQMFGGKRFLHEQTGDRRTAFRNALEDRVTYVEVYASDVRDSGQRRALESLTTRPEGR